MDPGEWSVRSERNRQAARDRDRAFSHGCLVGAGVSAILWLLVGLTVLALVG